MEVSATAVAQALADLDGIDAELLVVGAADLGERWQALYDRKEQVRSLVDRVYEDAPDHPVCVRFNEVGRRFDEQKPVLREARWATLSLDERTAEWREYRRGVAHYRNLRKQMLQAVVVIRRDRRQVRLRAQAPRRLPMSGRSRSSRRVVRRASKRGSPSDQSDGEPPAARPRSGSPGFDAVAALRGVRRLVQALNLDSAGQFELHNLLGTETLCRMAAGGRS